MRRDIPEIVQTAVDYAARDVSRAVADSCGIHGDIEQIRHNILGMLRAAAFGSINGIVRESKWVDPLVDDGWLPRSAAVGPGGIDADVLPLAIREWWDSMDEAAKYKIIMSHHPESQFVNEWVQYYQNKSEGDMAKEDPKLLEIYRSKITTVPKIPAEESVQPKSPQPEIGR